MAGKNKKGKSRFNNLSSQLGPISFLGQPGQYQQLLSAIQSMNDGLFALDKKWRFTYINKSAAKVFGKSEKQILGQHYGKIFPTYLSTDFFPKYQLAVKSKKTQIFQAYSKTLKSWFLVHAYPASNGISVYFQDISNQKKIVDELVKTSAQMQTIVENIKDAIVLINPEGKLIYANSAVAQIVGAKNSKQLINVSIYKLYQQFEILDETGQPINPAELPASKVFESKKYLQELTGIKKRGTNQTRWMLSKASPIFDKEGRVQMAVVIYEELTERIESEQHRELLFGGVSHELKNLLTSSKAYLFILKKRLQAVPDPELLDYAAKIEDRLSSLNMLMIDFIDLIRIRSGRLKLHKQLVDLNQLVKHTVDDLQALVSSHQIVTRSQILGKVNLDKDRIKQVMTNLLDNAIKYSPKAKLIKVKVAKTKGEKILISVKDFGQGIAKEHRDRIFDPFYRANWERQKKVGGVGLGLFISSEIIRLHGGKIIVKSQKSKGSTFTIVLPLAQKVT